MITGNGIDIIEVKRITQAIERWGEGFLNHVFTKEEIAYSKKQKFPHQHFAGRFAAKEAVFKALQNNDQVTWKDIEITHDKGGKPKCIFNRKNFKKKIFVSISHTKNYAIASALVSK